MLFVLLRNVKVALRLSILHTFRCTKMLHIFHLKFPESALFHECDRNILQVNQTLIHQSRSSWLKMAAQVQSDQLRPSLITQLDVSMSDIYASFSVSYRKEKENFVIACLEVFHLSFFGGNRSRQKEADY